MNIKKAAFNFRTIILFIALLLCIFAINPHPFNTGVSIRSVDYNGSASIAGIANPKSSAPPLSREIISSINGIEIKNIADYYKIESEFSIEDPVQIKTNKDLYKLIVKEKDGKSSLGMLVFDAPTSNIRKGLDLQGGTRLILEPEKEVSDEDMELVISNMNQRLNVFGLADVSIRPTTDLEGKKYIMVEVAGENAEEIRELILKQGKFEAKIENTTVFMGSKKDITSICKTADCSGISPYRAPVQVSQTEWSSTFQFAITLNPEAAKRMAAITKTLQVNGEYLSQPISLYLDDKLVDQLQIASDLKGREVLDIAISGPGFGRTKDESKLAALSNMKKLQTIMITGSLPVKLNVVKSDSISPVLGEAFTKNAIKMLLFALAAVALIIFLRYKKLAIVIPIFITSLSEVTLTLGIMILLRANLDIAAIAGLLVAIGTGVNDQIVIMDELTSKRNVELSWLRRMKNAFFIIFAAYFTAVASMIPLLFAGAGLLKGFAITSIVCVTVGVLITRPAFAAAAEELYKD